MTHGRSKLASVVLDNSLLLVVGTISVSCVLASGRRRGRHGGPGAHLRGPGFDTGTGEPGSRMGHSVCDGHRVLCDDCPSHLPAGPAIPFLLLLAIADDALGLLILAVFYPSGALSLPSLVVLMTAAVMLALWLGRRKTRSFWPYIIGPGWLAVLDGPVPGRLSSSAGTRADRAVHASQSA